MHWPADMDRHGRGGRQGAGAAAAPASPSPRLARLVPAPRAHSAAARWPWLVQARNQAVIDEADASFQNSGG